MKDEKSIFNVVWCLLRQLNSCSNIPLTQEADQSRKHLSLTLLSLSQYERDQTSARQGRARRGTTRESSNKKDRNCDRKIKCIEFKAIIHKIKWYLFSWNPCEIDSGRGAPWRRGIRLIAIWTRLITKQIPHHLVASYQQPIDNRLNNRIENTRTRLSNRSDGRDRRPTRTITKKEPRTGITGNIDRRIRIKEILLTIHGPTETMTVRSSIEVMSKIRYVPTSDFSFVLIKATDDKTLSRHRMHFVSFNSCNEFPTLTANAWLH
jgi:hypothetical protein